MIRVEIHLTDDEATAIAKIANQQGRSRKKQCEVYIRKMISDYKCKRSD